MRKSEERAARDAWSKSLGETYAALTGRSALPQEDNDAILAAYESRRGQVAPETLRAFFARYGKLADMVAMRAVKEILWRQPGVLCVYVWAALDPRGTKEAWPLAMERLRPFYRDVGLDFDGA